MRTIDILAGKRERKIPLGKKIGIDRRKMLQFK